MILTKEQVLADVDALPENFKTKDLDAIIKRYVKEKADVSALRDYVLAEWRFHRIYFYVSLDQMKDVHEQMNFIDKNLLFEDWWHTDELIKYAAKMDFDEAYEYAKRYVEDDDPFVKRWGYVMFIGKQCEGHANILLPMMQNQDHYYVQMGEAWLIAELAVYEPDAVYDWFQENDLLYNINGKAIQKICDSYRISDEWKDKYKSLRPMLKERSTTVSLELV